MANYSLLPKFREGKQPCVEILWGKIIQRYWSRASSWSIFSPRLQNQQSISLDLESCPKGYSRCIQNGCGALGIDRRPSYRSPHHRKPMAPSISVSSISCATNFMPWAQSWCRMLRHCSSTRGKCSTKSTATRSFWASSVSWFAHREH